jgi:hypothetical protein
MLSSKMFAKNCHRIPGKSAGEAFSQPGHASQFSGIVHELDRWLVSCFKNNIEKFNVEPWGRTVGAAKIRRELVEAGQKGKSRPQLHF